LGENISKQKNKIITKPNIKTKVFGIFLRKPMFFGSSFVFLVGMFYLSKLVIEKNFQKVWLNFFTNPPRVKGDVGI
jgi:hypothetical protein